MKSPAYFTSSTFFPFSICCRFSQFPFFILIHIHSILPLLLILLCAVSAVGIGSPGIFRSRMLRIDWKKFEINLIYIFHFPFPFFPITEHQFNSILHIIFVNKLWLRIYLNPSLSSVVKKEFAAEEGEF